MVNDIRGDHIIGLGLIHAGLAISRVNLATYFEEFDSWQDVRI